MRDKTFTRERRWRGASASTPWMACVDALNRMFNRVGEKQLANGARAGKTP